jgi:gliding motility-associated-like protein
MLSDSGRYHVEVENFCGVKKSNVIQAYPVSMSGVLIPNIITPNGDGINDFLVIDRSLPNSRINVVSRWGESVYSSVNYQNLWNAPDLAPGTYFLTISNPCLPQGYKGWLSVIK